MLLHHFGQFQSSVNDYIVLMYPKETVSTFAKNLRDTYWVRKVKAALVMDVGRLRPLVISLQIFLLITSTRPPFSVTSL